jgi:hypothetical protein
MFLWNILFENGSPLDELNSFIYSYMLRWTVKFSIGITEVIKSSYFPKSVK